mgnify:CR=1 FL=1
MPRIVPEKRDAFTPGLFTVRICGAGRGENRAANYFFSPGQGGFDENELLLQSL